MFFFSTDSPNAFFGGGEALSILSTGTGKKQYVVKKRNKHFFICILFYCFFDITTIRYDLNQSCGVHATTVCSATPTKRLGLLWDAGKWNIFSPGCRNELTRTYMYSSKATRIKFLSWWLGAQHTAEFVSSRAQHTAEFESTRAQQTAGFVSSRAQHTAEFESSRAQHTVEFVSSRAK